jgi:hypothetical protein
LCRFGQVEVFRQSLRLVNETARRVSDMRPRTGPGATWGPASACVESASHFATAIAILKLGTGRNWPVTL